MVDEQFIQRVYKSSVLWSLLILSYLMMTKLVSASAGFALGVGLALAGLHSFEAIVKNVVVPGKTQGAKVKMGVFALVKYAAFAVVIALTVKSGWISLPAFACGVGIPSAIIFLKALAHYFHTELEFHPFWGDHNHLDPQRVSAGSWKDR
jgi:hypothetical protein